VFALGSLGWKAFQDLCGTVLGTVLGQSVVAFRPTKDAGRDFAFEGEWRPVGREALTGHFVIQCKFKAGGRFYASDLRGELPKIRRLVRAGRCDSYVLMTNAGMTAETEAAIAASLEKQGVAHHLVASGDLLDKYIREFPRLRALVPRLYGLGDLTQILDERRYQQAAELLASMREDIAKFVITQPYRLAVEALLDHGFVLLLGAPAAGKSMIASALAAASIDMWGSRPLKIEAAGAFADAWNPLEPAQFLWIDDAFGATQYQRLRADEWNQLLPHLRAAVARGTKVVVTSRDYIWAEAVDDLKVSVFPALASGQVVVDVHDLSLDDKRQILYNHLKYGTQPREFRAAVKPFLEAVVHVDAFLPEVARRFGDPQFTSRLALVDHEVLAFFEKPVEHLTEVVAGLGADEFAALVLLFMGAGFRQSPVDLFDAETDAITRLGSSLGGVLGGLEALRGSLVVIGPGRDPGSEEGWRFKHPTIADAVQRRIATRRELLGIYLVGSPLDAVLREVTCGDVGLAGALVVPQRHFGAVVARLAEALRDPARGIQVANFLTSRCTSEFLAQAGPTIGSVELDLSNPATPRLAGRLRKLGLLAESSRQAIVSDYHTSAIELLDLRAITDTHVRELATEAELDGLLRRLRDEVVSGLDWVVDAERDDYDGSEAPEVVVQRLQAIIDTLADLYPDDPEVVGSVAEVATSIESLGWRLEEKWHGGPDDDYYDDWRERQAVSGPTDAGVFADIDE
jgi:hypothetical protein